MAGSLNKVMVIGNLGRDPEMRYMPSGRPVTNFSVAASRRWTTQEGEAREETEWFNVVVYDKRAEVANQYLSKGRRVYVEGSLRTRSWEGQDGQKHYRTEVIAQNFLMLDSRDKSAAPPADQPFPTEEIEAEDLPF